MVNAFVRHDDYETFASYLGVDYEDYYNLQLGIPDDDLDEFDEMKAQAAAFA
jgi:hypothetical protein